jgi:hypothetical protein
MLTGPIPVEHARVFPCGAYATSAFEPLRDFEQSRASAQDVQAVDRLTGEPLWVVSVIDADPETRVKVAKVKIAARQQPTLPVGSAGSPFTPVKFSGLCAIFYVSQATGRLAYSLRAEGVHVPSRNARSVRETPDAA